MGFKGLAYSRLGAMMTTNLRIHRASWWPNFHRTQHFASDRHFGMDFARQCAILVSCSLIPTYPSLKHLSWHPQLALSITQWIFCVGRLAWHLGWAAWPGRPILPCMALNWAHLWILASPDDPPKDSSEKKHADIYFKDHRSREIIENRGRFYEFSST